jgi:hypothetical protein
MRGVNLSESGDRLRLLCLHVCVGGAVRACALSRWASSAYVGWEVSAASYGQAGQVFTCAAA